MNPLTSVFTALGAPGVALERPRTASRLEAPPPVATDTVEFSSSKGAGVALAVLGAFAGLTGSVAHVSPPPPQAHELLILDDFQGEHSHGMMVEQVLEGTNTCSVGSPERKVKRVTVDLAQGLGDLAEPGSLDAYVRTRFLAPIAGTTSALEQVSGKAVLHQSQGASESRIVESLWGRASGDQAFRTNMASQLGVAADLPDRELLQSLLDHVHAVHGEEAISQAREGLLKAASAAEGRGAIRVISAGNQGELNRSFAKLGVTVPEGFYRSDLADPQAIIVGASDDHGTADPSDDTVAALASPHAGALIGIDGVDRPNCFEGTLVHSSGSSFSAPQVSVLLDKALDENPNLTRDQLLARLQASARPVLEGEAEVGAGIVDAQEFLLAK